MELQENVALGPRTTLGVGGFARYLVEARSEGDILQALSFATQRGVGVRVLGGGSNVVISDAGFDGLVICIALGGLTWAVDGEHTQLEVAAGEPWDRVVEQAVARNLAGLEGLSGIPGSTGATPIQNVGAYGQEVSETVVLVRAVDRSTRQAVELGAAECRFGYRDSFFKSEAPERFVVTSVRFRLATRRPPRPRYPDLQRELEARGIDVPTLQQLRDSVLAVRSKKSMLLDAHDENGRSCGSFFLNPIVTREQADRVRQQSAPAIAPTYPQPDGTVKLAAGWLIEQSGFHKGLRLGNVGLSTKHALAIVAHAGASASEVMAFAEQLSAGVAARFGITLSPEPSFWGV